MKRRHNNINNTTRQQKSTRPKARAEILINYYLGVYVTVIESRRTCAESFAIVKLSTALLNSTVTLSLLTVTIAPLTVPIEFLRVVA